MTARPPVLSYVIDATRNGVAADNSTDDTDALQEALDAAAVDVPGVTGNDEAARIVQLPPGRILVQSTITVPTNVHLRGHGPSGTYLVRQSGGTGNVIATTGVQQLLSDFGVICNQDTVDCIHIAGSGAAILSDARQVVRDVVAVGGRDGFVCDNSEGQANEVRLSRCTSMRARRHGFRLSTTDAWLEGCTAGDFNFGDTNVTDTYGFYVNATNSRVYGCKAYGGNGSVAKGFLFANRCQVAACEAQDCGSRGYEISGPVTLTGCTADSCGSDGYNISSAGSQLVGCSAVNRGGGEFTMPRAFRFEGGSSDSVIVGFKATSVTQLYFNGALPNDAVIEAQNRRGSQSLAYAASITPDPWKGENIVVGTLTGNLSVGLPQSDSGNIWIYPVGMLLRLHLTQDGTGGRTVTWNAAFKTTAAIDTTASTTTVITFSYDGTNWREVTRAKT